MKLGIHTAFLSQFEFGEGLCFAKELGAESVEITTVGSAMRTYCDLDQLLNNKKKLDHWQQTLNQNALQVSALAVHGEPLSPNKEVSLEYTNRFKKACRLAEATGINCLTTNAGLPEGEPDGTAPVWVIDTTKQFNRSILDWQWDKRVLPFWKEHAKIAQDHGCSIAIEPWIGEIVYSPITLMQLRDAVGPTIGCNFDPSHLMAQRIDLPEAVRYLGDAILHVHIKDCRTDQKNQSLKGLFDMTPLDAPERRSWMWTLIGWGHDELFWREFLTALQLVQYEGTLSIEMECDYIQNIEGLRKSVEFLKPMLLSGPPLDGERWWQLAGFHNLVED